MYFDTFPYFIEESKWNYLNRDFKSRLYAGGGMKRLQTVSLHLTL